jgi:hypothetical protein
LFSAGWSCRERAVMTSISTRACSSDTPRRKRATPLNEWLLRSEDSRSLKRKGIQNDDHSAAGKLNSRGMTPITVNGSSSIRTFRPITLGSPPNCLCQNR